MPDIAVPHVKPMQWTGGQEWSWEDSQAELTAQRPGPESPRLQSSSLSLPR